MIQNYSIFSDKNTRSRFAAETVGASAVEYAVLLSILIAFLSGVWFLGTGLKNAYHRVAADFQNGEANSAKPQAGDTLTQSSAENESVPATSNSWKYALGSILGISLVFGSLIAGYFQMRKKPVLPEIPEPEPEMPFSIQMALFEKRQHIFHTLLKDNEGLWKDGVLVRHLMTTKLITVLPTAPAAEIAEMVREKGVRHIMVCDDDKKLHGIISDRDIYAKKGATAQELMSRRLCSTTPETPINQAITCLMQERISCLPVLENDRLCGLITTTDMLLALQCTLQIWGFFAETLRDDFTDDLNDLQKEMAEETRHIDEALALLNEMQNNNPIKDFMPLFAALQKTCGNLHDVSKKIEHYRGHCLENVNMVQKISDF